VKGGAWSKYLISRSLLMACQPSFPDSDVGDRVLSASPIVFFYRCSFSQAFKLLIGADPVLLPFPPPSVVFLVEAIHPLIPKMRRSDAVDSLVSGRQPSAAIPPRAPPFANFLVFRRSFSQHPECDQSVRRSLPFFLKSPTWIDLVMEFPSSSVVV